MRILPPKFPRLTLENFRPGRLLVLFILITTILYPLLYLLDRSTVLDGSRSLANYIHFWDAEAPYIGALWGSVWISLASVFFAGIVGIGLAFLFERISLPAKSFLAAVATLPIVLPLLVGVVEFIFPLGESVFIPRVFVQIFNLPPPPFFL